MMKSYTHGKSGGKKWSKILLFTGLFVVLLAVAAAFGIKSIYEQNLKPVNSEATEDIVFVISAGDTVGEIARNLKSKDLIRSEHAFNQYVRSNQLGEEFYAGTYSLRQSYDVQTIVTYLVDGRVDTGLCTILPGQRIDQIQADFQEKCGFSEAEIQAGFKASSFADHPALVDKPESVSLEGYLYPDSYELTAETKVSTILGQSLDEMADALTPDIRAGLTSQGLSVYEGIILASIVEREVSGANPDDRPRVAQVFLSRLSQDIALESDATAKYGAVVDGVDESLSFSETLRYESSYNTYFNKGLPPTPVSNVSMSSLVAVADPARTDYMFFVAGCDKITRFSKTFEQHQAYIDKHGVNGSTCD